MLPQLASKLDSSEFSDRALFILYASIIHINQTLRSGKQWQINALHYSKTAKNTRIQDFRGSEKGFSTMDQTSANNRFMTLIILAALQIYSRCSLEEAYRNLQILVLQESLMTWPYDLMTSVLDAYILKDNIYQKCHLA